jgi:protein O-GlcNAc transferase
LPTRGARPPQVLYKGFVGSLGARYVQQMVADARVAPPEHAAHFAERLLYMPHTYVVNDYRQQAGPRALAED